MTKYSAICLCHIVLTLKLLFSDWLQILRDASNKLKNAHKISINLQCNDGYPGSCRNLSEM